MNYLVKSADLDTWTPVQIENMLKWGNAKANFYWESELPPNFEPPESNIEQFIRAKYERKQYAMKGDIPDPDTIPLPDGLAPMKGANPAPATAKKPAPAVTPHQPQVINMGAPAAAAPTNTTNLATTKSASQDLFDAFQSAPTGPAPQATATGNNAPLVSNDLKANILSLYSNPGAGQATSPSAPLSFGQQPLAGMQNTVRAQPQGAEFFGQPAFNSFTGFNSMPMPSNFTPNQPNPYAGMGGASVPLSFPNQSIMPPVGMTPLQAQPASLQHQAVRPQGTIGGIPNFGANFGSSGSMNGGNTGFGSFNAPTQANQQQQKSSAIPFASASSKYDDDGSDEFLKTMAEEIKNAGTGPESASVLKFSAGFPNNPFNNVIADKVTELQINVTNTASTTQTLFGVYAVLTKQSNFSQVLFNLTAARYNVALPTLKTATLPFKFKVETEAQDLGLVVYVDYFDKEEVPHRAVAFKKVIKVSASDYTFDLAGISIIVILGGLGYLAVTSLFNSPTKVVKTKPNVAALREEYEAKKDVLADEWIPDHLKETMSTVTNDAINYLVYRYLLESGFTHSTFAFQQESAIHTRDYQYNNPQNGGGNRLPPHRLDDIRGSRVPPGALIAVIQKGLQFMDIEYHTLEDGTKKKCAAPFSLVAPHECIEVEDDEESKSQDNENTSAPNSSKKSKKDDNNDAMETNEPNSNTASIKRERKEGKKGERSERDKRARRDSSLLDGAMFGQDGDKAAETQISPDQVTILEGHVSEVFVCAWNPAHNSLASGSGDGTARIWHMSEDQSDVSWTSVVLKHDNKDGAKDVTTVDWNPSGTLLATGSYDGQARIWTSSGELKFLLQKHEGPVFAVRWNKSGTALATVSMDKTAIVWNVETGTVKQQFTFHEAPSLDLDWKDDDTFATCSTDRTIFVCQIGVVEQIRCFRGHTSEVNTIKWDPTGTILASCSDDTTAKIWSLDSDGPLFDLIGHSKEVYGLSWAPETSQRILATVAFDATVRLWDATSGACIFAMQEHSAPVYSVAFSPDAEYLITGSFDQSLIIWNAKTGSLVRSYTGASGIYEVSWASSGEKISACYADGTVAVLDIVQYIRGDKVTAGK
ncbi:hypothetical protein HDV05_007003 [Chytridiales sp. JEL 0842]|nr:hypothetical protein HDV05_007003 [Chytridiales sp. JEL 0842]